MLRPVAAALFALSLAACYDPERVESSATGASQQMSPADDPADDPDDCDADCQVCAAYCTVELSCAAEPSSAEDCAWNCLSWLELASDECSAAYREAATCIGALDCPGYDDPSTCVPELQGFHAECDDEAEAEADDALPLMSR